MILGVLHARVGIGLFMLLSIIYYLLLLLLSISIINYFTQHIPLHIPRRSLNKPKPIPDYLPD